MSQLRTRREALGMRREELAVKSGLSANYLQKLENDPGAANPTLEVARAIADALDTTVDELFPAPAPATESEAR